VALPRVPLEARAASNTDSMYAHRHRQHRIAAPATECGPDRVPVGEWRHIAIQPASSPIGPALHGPDDALQKRISRHL
jgi:hypothetical protein